METFLIFLLLWASSFYLGYRVGRKSLTRELQERIYSGEIEIINHGD